MEAILSRQNDRIKYAVKLRDSASFRFRERAFIIEGARLCFDAFKSGVEVSAVYITDEAASKYSEYVKALLNSQAEAFNVSKEVSEKLSDTKNPQGVFCVCKMLDKNTFIGKIKYIGKYAALENISNPANFGAICRTAEAVGLDGIIVGGGCDIYNPKAMRSSMGALFRLDVFETDNLPDFLSGLKAEGMKIYSSVPDENAVKITEADMENGVVSVIGNEGDGITAETKNASTALITIPMKGRAESLNAAEAASIIMWEMMR